jgi:OOP family OmpA-OmpF porin
MLVACTVLIAGVAAAQDAPAVPVPLGTPPADNAGAPTTTYVPPTTDTQQPLPPAADTPQSLPPLPAPAEGAAEEAAPPVAPLPGDEPEANVYHGEHEYVGFLASYVIPDSRRDTTRHGGGFSLIYGHLFNEHLSLEVNPAISIFDTGENKGTDFYQYGGTVDLAYAFTSRTQSAITPFVLAGIGGDYEDVQPASGKKGTFDVDAGLGLVTKPFFYGIKFRAEGRIVHDFNNEFRSGPGIGVTDYRASAGVEIPLGQVVRSVQLESRPVQIVQPVSVPRPWIDSDGDGVDDEHDKCPGTPHGFKVDSDGCIIPGQTIVLRGVTFEFNKTRLTPNAKAVLDGLVPAFSGQPSLHVEIAGHTDSIGGTAYNQGLSQRRADAVREYLIGQGAHPEQITAVGYGKTRLLINPEKTSDDRELNRRVEFTVVGK